MFDRIVLNIPHSSPDFPFGKECWDKGIDVSIERWTDWFTDDLFILNHPDVFPIIYPYSRFFCDVERLVDDPLDSVGQGIIYRCFDGLGRRLIESDVEAIMDSYFDHINRLRQAIISERELLIDCHSFPSDLSDVDICIGYNNDWSRPNNLVLKLVISHFINAGYNVGVNNPYANSISPQSRFIYSSVMIEVNKGVYMKNKRCYMKLKKAIHKLYHSLLLMPTIEL